MTQSMSDPYTVLGIPRNASRQTAREAYRRLAKQFHPDLAADPAAGERMRRINEAWRIISSPTRRPARPAAAATWRPTFDDRSRPFHESAKASGYQRPAPRQSDLQHDTWPLRPAVVVAVGATLLLFAALVGVVPPLFVLLLVVGMSRIFKAVG